MKISTQGFIRFGMKVNIKRRNIRKLIKRSIADKLYLIISSLDRQIQKFKSEKVINNLQGCGYGVVLNGDVNISHPKLTCIGNNVHIGTGAYFSTHGGLTIGDNTHISRNVCIYTNNHDYQGACLPHDDINLAKPVSIGRNVWIGMNVNIAPGTKIGDGAIIGMGSVVSGVIPELAIVGAPKPNIIKYRDSEHYASLEEAKLFGGVAGKKLTLNQIEDFWPNSDETEMIFVLSTGRSGSQTMAKIFNDHPEVDSYHEPHFQLIRLSTEYAHGEKSEAEVRHELSSIYKNSRVFKKNMIYLESEHRLFNLVPFIVELIPHAKFIWVIRNGYDVVSSTFGRGWYDKNKEHGARPELNEIPGIWDFYRIQGDKCGEFDTDTWDALSAFEKNCWYWNYINSNIEENLSALKADKWQFVQTENLGENMAQIQDFIGVKHNLSLPVITANKATYKVTKHKNWNASQLEAFDRFCKLNNERWGYK